jgi:hypothetical protein
VRIINAHDNDSIRGDLLNGIEIPGGINGVYRSEASPTWGGTSHAAALILLHTRGAPLAHESLLIIFTAGGTLRCGSWWLIPSSLIKGGAIGVETRSAEEGLAEGLLAGALKGLGIGDDTLGASVGFKDGVGNVVIATRGNHVVVEILVFVRRVNHATLAQVAWWGGEGVVVVGEVRGVVTVSVFRVG